MDLRKIEKYGVPQALYVDWKNLCKRTATAREQLRGEEPVTQFGRMCEKLGMGIIAAGLPHAKGKVMVCQWQDGRMEIAYWGRKLTWREIASVPLRPLATPALFRVAVCASP
jgi:hypothetical protein